MSSASVPCTAAECAIVVRGTKAESHRSSAVASRSTQPTLVPRSNAKCYFFLVGLSLASLFADGLSPCARGGLFRARSSEFETLPTRMQTRGARRGIRPENPAGGRLIVRDFQCSLEVFGEFPNLVENFLRLLGEVIEHA